MKKPFLKRKLIQLGRRLGYELVDSKEPAELFPWLVGFVRSSVHEHQGLEGIFLREVLKGIHRSKAQLCQDLMVLTLTNHMRNGFFVEFGATDGVTLSNTYLLETSFGWNGILAEPARTWHQSLNRTRSCLIDHRCVWSRSGERLRFIEAREAELSTLYDLKSSDGHWLSREDGLYYDVETVTLLELLETHRAPRTIDYLSLDTEGSERLILEAFDFSRYDFSIITVEHNFTRDREKIRACLEKNGYVRILSGFSQWDDWYANNKFL